MTRLCTVCSHPQRPAIDLALVRHHTSYRNIARQFQVTDDALLRHQHTHLGLSWQQMKEWSQMLSTDNLLLKLSELDDECRAMLTEARTAGDLRVALQAVHESRATIETFSRLGVLSDLEKRLAAVEAEQEHH